MKRREFIKSAAAVGLAGGASVESGCAVISAISLDDAALIDVEEFLRTVDEEMSVIAEGSVFEEGAIEARDMSDVERTRFRHDEDLARKSLRTIYFAGMFGDLPEEQQRHPDVQERLFKHLPEFSEALERTETYLSKLDEEQLERIRAKLEAEPDFVMRIAEILGGQAAEAGIGVKRRLQLRSNLTQLSARLRKQPPALLIDEYLDKVARMRERHEPGGEVLRQVGLRVDEACQKGATMAPGTGGKQPPAEGWGQGKNYTFALVMLGLGAILSAVGWGIGLSSSAVGLLFVGTVGVIFILIGLIALIVVAAR